MIAERENDNEGILMPTPALPTHAPRIWPRMAPGAHYVRLLTEDARVLAEHIVPTNENNRDLIEQVGAEDQQTAFRYLRRNQSGVVFHLTYDGDDGQCLEIRILAASDVRAFEKARQREARPEVEEPEQAKEEAPTSGRREKVNVGQ